MHLHPRHSAGRNVSPLFYTLAPLHIFSECNVKMWPCQSKVNQLSHIYRAARVNRPRGRAPKDENGREMEWDSEKAKWKSISKVDNTRNAVRKMSLNGAFPRPRGPTPKGKRWDSIKGEWIKLRELMMAENGEWTERTDSGVLREIGATYVEGVPNPHFHLQNSSPLHRDGLYVTSHYMQPKSPFLEESEVQDSGMGLYTTSNIREGEFVAFYTGRLMTQEQIDRLPRADQDTNDTAESYFMGLDVDKKDLMIVVPLHQLFDDAAEKIGNSVNYEINPAAMINEPSYDGEANVYARTETIEVDVEGQKNKFYAVCLYTCKEVLAGQELLFHYGSSKEMKEMREKRNYTVGKPCHKGANPTQIRKQLRNVQERAMIIISSVHDDWGVASTLWRDSMY